MIDMTEPGRDPIGSSREVRLRRIALIGVPILLTLAVAAQTSLSRRSSSITYDETFYIGVGVKTLHGGGLDADLTKFGVAPLPLALNMVPGVWLAGASPHQDVWAPRPDNRRLIDVPRMLTTLTTLVPLILLAFGWLHHRRGLLAATLGAGMLATSPSLLAHASLATTDAAFAFLATLAALAIGLYLRAPSPLRLALAAAAIGMAFAAKYTGVLLIPCFVLARSFDFVRAWWTGSGGRTRLAARYAVDVAGCLAIAVLTAWACHGFQLDPERTWRGLHLPAFMRSFEYQLNHNKGGHPTFYAGVRALKGWWSYYPFTMLAKSTLPELALAMGGFWAALRGLRSPTRGGLRIDRERAILIWFVMLLAVALMRSPLCLGHRYTLALYPAIILLAVDATAQAIRAGRMRKLWGAVLIGGQLATSLLAAPGYLSYFNPLFGGPDAAWQYLADSNIDWGQDLPALKELVDRKQIKTLAVDYFGTASLADYGIEADPITALHRPLYEYDALAVSVTQLNSVYPRPDGPLDPHVDLYKLLRRIPPQDRAGSSIFVYNLRRPGARQAFFASMEAAWPAAVQAAARDSRSTTR
ncbi:hypothetical protein [Paludisphaera mucosa]|uniref:Glycosyltransferase RgtA/B/C/D-like domain-containing protein n=1 Tax=Paludisphaera mucosa TaxID=3030827 RepID=A0ABT6F9E3_9BACT|nr:hypothetical protein [Paludisphaera mucosa]MDG3004208.1 hypothetical protein [Paludisphaera mucosa]